MGRMAGWGDGELNRFGPQQSINPKVDNAQSRDSGSSSSQASDSRKVSNCGARKASSKGCGGRAALGPCERILSPAKLTVSPSFSLCAAARSAAWLELQAR